VSAFRRTCLAIRVARHLVSAGRSVRLLRLDWHYE